MVTGMFQKPENALPVTRLGRQFERKAIRIRQFAGAGYLEPLDPFELAAKIGLRVVSLDELRSLSPEVRFHLTEVDVNGWSGGASPVLPDGSRVVILNPKQSRTRHSATLMEEICHVLLGHKADRLGVAQSSGAHRDYDTIAAALKQTLAEKLAELRGYPIPQLLEQRYQRLMSYGLTG